MAAIIRTKISRNSASTDPNNNGSTAGGGIYSDGVSTISIVDSTIADNIADYGGGIFCIGSTSITGCTISGNLANLDGDGICSMGGTLSIKGATRITSNQAITGYGGGIYSYPQITGNSTITTTLDGTGILIDSNKADKPTF